MADGNSGRARPDLDRKRWRSLLSPKRYKAAVALAAGEGPLRVAEEVGVGRSTSWRWRTLDPAFVACINAQTRDFECQRLSEREALRRKAIDRLSAALDSREERVALKAAAVLLATLPPPPEPTWSPTSPDWRTR